MVHKVQCGDKDAALKLVQLCFMDCYLDTWAIDPCSLYYLAAMAKVVSLLEVKKLENSGYSVQMRKLTRFLV